MLFEEFNDETARFYVLTVLRGGYRTEILRKIWFDRADLQVSRLQTFAPKGVLLADMPFSIGNRKTRRAAVTGTASAASGAPAVVSFARSIDIDRPHDDYRLDLQASKITLNEPIPADRFQLAQPRRSRIGACRRRPPRPESNAELAERAGAKTMMGELIARNLLHRPLRTMISVLAVGVEVALVVLIVGLTSGLLTETAKRIEGIGADIVLQPPAASIFLNFSGSPMPIKIGAKLSGLKYVQAVAPALLQFSSTGGVDTICGIEPESFRAVSGGFVFFDGHDMEGPDDLLVDDWAAKSKHIKVGDTYNLLNHDWHVVGIVEHGKGARLFVPLATLQDLVARTTKPPFFF